MQIQYMDERQAVISSLSGFCVVDLQTRIICYKFIFQDRRFLNYTVSYNAVSVPRFKNGVIVKFGSLEKAIKNCGVDNKKKCDNYPDLNHVYAQFNKIFFRMTKGYLLVDEKNVDWEKSKNLPMQIMRSDYLITSAEQEHQKTKDKYKEYGIVSQTYNTNYSIFEAIIRASIIEDTLPITDH